jgi:hypothetical protein
MNIYKAMDNPFVLGSPDKEVRFNSFYLLIIFIILQKFSVDTELKL